MMRWLEGRSHEGEPKSMRMRRPAGVVAVQVDGAREDGRAMQTVDGEWRRRQQQGAQTCRVEKAAALGLVGEERNDGIFIPRVS